MICDYGMRLSNIVFRALHHGDTKSLTFFQSLGVYIINLKKTWEKLLLAARAIVAIENPADVCVISSRNTGQVTLNVTSESSDLSAACLFRHWNVGTLIVMHSIKAGH